MTRTIGEPPGAHSAPSVPTGGAAALSADRAFNVSRRRRIATGGISRSQSRLTVLLVARNGSSACAITGTGSGTATLFAIDGTLDVTFTGCDGLDVQPPAGNRVTLTKQ